MRGARHGGARGRTLKADVRNPRAVISRPGQTTRDGAGIRSAGSIGHTYGHDFRPIGDAGHTDAIITRGGGHACDDSAVPGHVGAVTGVFESVPARHYLRSEIGMRGVHATIENRDSGACAETAIPGKRCGNFW